jgi:hypothetical protein
MLHIDAKRARQVNEWHVEDGAELTTIDLASSTLNLAHRRFALFSSVKTDNREGRGGRR